LPLGRHFLAGAATEASLLLRDAFLSLVLDLLGTEACFLLGAIVMMEDGKFEKVRFQFSIVLLKY